MWHEWEKINVYIILMDKFGDKRPLRRCWIRCMVSLKRTLN